MASGPENIDLDKQRIRAALVQHIMSLCQVGLRYNVELSVEGLLGITLDKTDIFLINIKEVVTAELGKTPESPRSEHIASQASEVKKSKRWRKRKHSRESLSRPTLDVESPLRDASSSHSGIKTEVVSHSEQEDCTSTLDSVNQDWTENAEDGNDSDNCLVVKEEPGISAEYGLMRSDCNVTGFSDVELTDPTFCSMSQQSSSKRHRSSSGFLTSNSAAQLTHESQQAMLYAQHLQTSGGPSLGTIHKARRAGGASHRQPQEQVWVGSPKQNLAGPSKDESFRPTQAENTFRITLSYIRNIQRWLATHKSEYRELESIAPEVLNRYLEEMWISLRKPDGAMYGVTTLSTFRSRLNYYLREKTGGHISLDSEVFQSSNDVYSAVMNMMKQMTCAPGSVQPTSVAPRQVVSSSSSAVSQSGGLLQTSPAATRSPATSDGSGASTSVSAPEFPAEVKGQRTDKM